MCRVYSGRNNGSNAHLPALSAVCIDSDLWTLGPNRTVSASRVEQSYRDLNNAARYVPIPVWFLVLSLGMHMMVSKWISGYLFT